MTRIDILAIYGVGLLGGSIGLAARARGLARQIVGVGRNEKRLEQACSLGAIDSYITRVSELPSDCRFAVACVPVGLIPQAARELGLAMPPGSIVTDVGSAKARVVRQATDLLEDCPEVEFIGSHPMAGSEKTGVEHARADLYENAVCVVTPSESTSDVNLESVECFWRALGAKVLRLTPERHDRWVALTSHVPHLAASALCNLLSEDETMEPDILRLVGPGFRDTTRIAAGDPILWRDICLDNGDSIRTGLDRFMKQIERLREAVASSDVEAIEALLRSGQRLRNKAGSKNHDVE